MSDRIAKSDLLTFTGGHIHKQGIGGDYVSVKKLRSVVLCLLSELDFEEDKVSFDEPITVCSVDEVKELIKKTFSGVLE